MGKILLRSPKCQLDSRNKSRGLAYSMETTVNNDTLDTWKLQRDQIPNGLHTHTHTQDMRQQIT